MRYGAILSLLMHLAILLLILYGLPDLFSQQEVIEPVAVQLATVADLTAQPQPQQQQQAKTPPTPVMKPAPTPPAPQAPSPPPAPVPPQPAEQTPPPVPPQEAPQPPQPTVAEPPQPIIIPDKTQPPPPQPPPQQQAQIEQAPVPKLRPKTPPDQTKPKVQPATQTADFNSLLKNLTQSQPQSQTADITDQTQPPQPTPDQSAPIGQQLSSSDLDAVRSQIAGCWYLDPGKKGAESMVVEIHVDLGPDGTVLGNPQILDTMRAATDPSFQAEAEAARRALLKCSPLRLPPDKYDTWKSTIFRFSPGGMLG